MGQPGFQRGDTEKGQDGCQEIREVVKGIPCPEHCTELIRDTGVLQQGRQLRDVVEAPIRQSLLTEHSYAWPDTIPHKSKAIPS